MKKKTVGLLIFFIMLFSSGVALFIFSRQADSGAQLDNLLDQVGNAHAVLALIVSILVILHIRGNIKRFKNLRKEYEDKINKLQAEHKSKLEEISKVN